jgi:hypothetical protein
MAVDTKEKRMNAAAVGRPWMRSKLPGANDQAWRIASGNGYGGNEIEGGLVEGFQYTIPAARFDYTLPGTEMDYTIPAAHVHYTIPETVIRK